MESIGNPHPSQLPPSLGAQLEATERGAEADAASLKSGLNESARSSRARRGATGSPERTPRSPAGHAGRGPGPRAAEGQPPPRGRTGRSDRGQLPGREAEGARRAAGPGCALLEALGAQASGWRPRRARGRPGAEGRAREEREAGAQGCSERGDCVPRLVLRALA